jgi:hypothetical protein
MSDAIFLKFPDDEKDSHPGNWCFWLDPKSFQPTDDYKNGTGIMFDGYTMVNSYGIIVLCYATLPNSTKAKQDELYRVLQGNRYVPLKNQQAIGNVIREKLSTLRAPQYNELKMRMPTFMKNATWYETLLAAPELHRKKRREEAKQRIPQTYQELQDQAHKLYEALQKTTQVMKTIKQKCPELNLPNVPYDLPE